MEVTYKRGVKPHEDIFDATPENIWNYRQNHPELVIKDLRTFGFDGEVIKTVRASMMARGINKWLKVRRDLIAYKKKKRHEIKELSERIPVLKKEVTDKWVDFSKATAYEVHEYHKAREKYLEAKALLKEKQEVRSSLKNLCMTDRWQVWEGKKLQDMNTIKASD